jgi:hypothetical protein
MQNCSGSVEVSRLHALQLAFPRDAFVRLVHAFYPIFKLAAELGGRFDRSNDLQSILPAMFKVSSFVIGEKLDDAGPKPSRSVQGA